LAEIFQCNQCHQTISAEAAPGTQVRCPLCGSVVTVPMGQAPPVMPVAGFQPLGYAGGKLPMGSPSAGMAIAAMVCGIVGMLGCAPVGIVGLILGIVALVRESREPNRYRGRGMAIAGICTGSISLVIVPLMIAILLPSLSRARELSKRTVCSANMRGIGQAFYIYAQSNNGAFPDSATNWMAQVSGDVTPRQLICPSDARVSGTSYCYVPGYHQNGDPRQIILFEDPKIHNNEGGNILYLDSHVQFVKQPGFQQAINSIRLPNGKRFHLPEE